MTKEEIEEKKATLFTKEMGPTIIAQARERVEEIRKLDPNLDGKLRDMEERCEIMGDEKYLPVLCFYLYQLAKVESMLAAVMGMGATCDDPE